MTITSLTGIGGPAPQTGVTTASDKLQAAFASIASGNSDAGDVAAVSIASQLQSRTAALNVVSGNLTQALSLTQVASGGIGQIQNIVTQLQALASQAASPTLNAENRKQLNQQFQQLSGEFNNIAQTTSFNGNSLLNGNIGGSDALSLDNILGQTGVGSDNSLSIPDLSTNGLFAGQSTDISTVAGANQASALLGNVINQVVGAQASVGAFQQTLDFAAANVDSAITNQQAAQSSISDTDLASASTQTSLADIQYNASIALAAQANKLNPALLQLVG